MNTKKTPTKKNANKHKINGVWYFKTTPHKEKKQ
jgi:hypothetical protein